MKVRYALAGLALIVSSSLITAQVMSQNNPDKPKPVTPPAGNAPDEAKMMEAMQKYGAPNENHKKLDVLVGEWTVTHKMWMDPASQPQESSGNATFEWILDGRYVALDITGDAGGMPFHGMGIMGHDNFRNQYVSGWIDNMSTGLATSTGKYNDATKTFTFSGKMDDVMSGRKDVNIRAVMNVSNKDRLTEEVFCNDEAGKEFKCAEVVYTRAQ